jgi:hypothetical protein
MKKVDIKKRFREVKWITEHTLTNEQFKYLIAQKTERARQEIEKRKSFSNKKLHV